MASEEGSDDLCYICYEEGTESKPFIKKQVCKCKGSIKCHQICLEISKFNTNPSISKNFKNTCSICKTPYNVNSFLDECNWQIYEERNVKYITGIKITDEGIVKHGDYYRLENLMYIYSIAEKGSYYDNCKDGLWEHFHINGNLRSSELYHKGKKHGKFVVYFDNKEIYQEGEYVNDKLHGIYRVKLSSNSDIIFKNVYEYGTPIGIHAECLDYDIFEGMKIYRGSYVNGLRDGVWTLYNFAFGKISKPLKKVTYKNGVLDGKLCCYDKDGKICKEIHYSNGKKHGIRRLFNSEGNVMEYMYYKEDVLDGPFCITKIENNKIIPLFKGQFKNGNHYGKHFFYGTPSKIPTQIYNVDSDGNLDDSCYFYDYSGSLQAMFSYKHGVLHGKQIINDSYNLDFRLEFMAKNGLASGKVRYTNSENKIEEIYVNKISLKELAEIINLEILIVLPSYLDEFGSTIHRSLDFYPSEECYCDECIGKNYDDEYDSYYEGRSNYSGSDDGSTYYRYLDH